VLVLEETDRLLEALDLESESRRRASLEYRQSLELLRALRLSPSLEVCEAILQNPLLVPRSRLDPEWCKRYGIS
jgi:hypothetical protein